MYAWRRLLLVLGFRYIIFTISVLFCTPCKYLPVFTALHVMQTRYSDENSVCPSVCLSVRLSVRPSVTHVIPEKRKKDLSRFVYHTKEHLS